MTENEIDRMNIYERLAQIRDDFAKEGIEKRGLNTKLTSKYFTLDDIILKSRAHFHEYRILPLDTFTKDEAKLTLVDMDAPSNKLEFTIPMREYLGNAAVTPVQAMGATVTYYRRYLYSLALDLAETDELEEGFREEQAPRQNPHATPQQRQSIKQNLTNMEDNATELQIEGLRSILKKLKKADPSKEDMIKQIAVETKGFTRVSKTKCEEIIKLAMAMYEDTTTRGGTHD